MNNFDENFNGIDEKTSRPISGGHADSIWFIAVVCWIIVVFSGVMIIGTLLQAAGGKGINFAAILFNLLSIGLFLPQILLLFKRSILAYKLSIVLVPFFLLGTILLGALKQPEVGMFFMFVILQIFFTWLERGLKKDGFLTAD